MAWKTKKIHSPCSSKVFVVIDRVMYYIDILEKYFPRFISYVDVSKVTIVVFI